MSATSAPPGPVWGFAGVVAGGLFALWQARRAANTADRQTSGSVESSDAKVVFDAQQSALVMSEQMRHDLRDQVERCQGEIQKLKDERDAMETRLRAQAVENTDALDHYRQRVETLEDELFDMGERLKREEDRGPTGTASAPGDG